jgi:hypothetical protein
VCFESTYSSRNLSVKRLLFVLYVKAAGKLCMGVEKIKKEKKWKNREKKKSPSSENLSFPPLFFALLSSSGLLNFLQKIL